MDAEYVARNLVQIGIATQPQIDEVWEELGKKGGEAEPLLRALERKGHITPWQSSKLLRDDKDGYILGGYRILYKIKAGSFGRVYRGDDPRTGNVVAIKVLRRKWSEDSHNIELFEREGRLGMSLDHPNIVRILNVSRDTKSKQYYIVMEFVEGGNLREFLNIRKKVEPAETLRILEDCASGLAYAYSKGVTHRDMKLSNVLLSTSGTAKLVDFGLAGVYGDQHEGVEKNQVDRTVDYAGLERATGVLPGDTRSDMYFLGCMMHEILTGESPIEMTKEARMRMARERFTGIPALNREEFKAPPSFFHLIETMTKFEPQQRYQTPSQLLDAVRNVRREIEGKGNGKTQPTLFIAERDERLQDIFRTKFKENGFRVLLSADPMRALDRFRQQPFEALIVDAQTVGEDAMYVFERVVDAANDSQIPCAAVLLLGKDQTNLSAKLKQRSNVSCMVYPVKFRKLLAKVRELMAGFSAPVAAPPASEKPD